MGENKLARKIKKSAFVKLLLSLPLLVGAALLIWGMIAGKLLSPVGFTKPLDIHSLGNVDFIASRPMNIGTFRVSITAKSDQIVDTGVAHTSDNVDDGYYMAVAVDNKFLLCYVNPATYKAVFAGDSFTFDGVLNTPEDDAVTMVLDDMQKQGFSEPEAQQALYKYSIDTTSNGLAEHIFLYASTFLLLAFGLFVLLTSVMSMANPRNYSQVKKLYTAGETNELFEDIEREYSETEALALGRGRGCVTLGKTWIVVEMGLNVRFMRADSLLWAYKFRRTTKAYGVITTGVYFALMLRSAHKTLTASGTEFNVDSALAAVSENYPWVVMGYTANLEAIWKSHREQFADYAKEKGAPNPM